MTRPRRFTSLPWARIALLCAAIALTATVVMGTGTGPATAVAPAMASTGAVEPSDRHRRVARLIAEVMERQHYRQASLDDKLSAQVFERYLEALDGNRSYLLASDVSEFEKYRFEMDDLIKSADLEPPFWMFGRLQERNRERIAHAIALLDTEPDFTVDEDFRFDRSDEAWPATVAELDELWRKRVKNDVLSLTLAGKTWPEAQEVLRKRYERLLKRVDQVTADDVFETFMNAYSHVYDPHSNYLSPRNSEEYNIAMSLSYEGIGASLQLIDDYVTVVNILPGGPAAVSGEVKANDRITAVGQGSEGTLTDVVGWRLDDVVQLIRGPVNTVVRLQVLPAGATPGSPESVVVFTRNKVTLEAQAAKKEVHKIRRGDQELSIGVIDVPSFYQDYQARSAGEADYRSTTRDVRRLVDELKREGVGAIVIDLRNNGGGHLSEATSLVGLFIERGPVVQLRETGGRIEVLDDPEPGVAWDGPLVVMVNRASASASEIFAGAIQDYGRGVVVGQQTYGKGSVQNLYPLDRYALGPKSGFGQLTVTIGKYYRVTGDSTQHRGVTPDIELPSLISTEDVGESTRDSALPWDRIRPATFERDAGVEGELPLLDRLHHQRAGDDADLLALEGDREAVDKLRSQTTLSLNAEKRKVERLALEQAQLARENVRRKAHGLEPLASATDLDEADAPDALLAEAVEIAGDAVIAAQPAGGALLARTLSRSAGS
ncbi:MAG: carboxyl-terminal processing protease [Proteobacteria bacterium]|nr:carboxyl-terminal processing protease [Pseudomonadota bacterium]